jgi:hypothetical protein
MIEAHKILYATIKTWELSERLRRDDNTFDAFKHLAEKIGHKNESTLRKMCEPRSSSNCAKLGFEDAFIIMTETNDYRLIHHMRERLKETKRSKHQFDLFSTPIRSLEDIE